MSRDDRDQRGGHRSRYWTSDANHADFARATRKAGRAKAKQALRNGREPEPIYPVEREYFD